VYREYRSLRERSFPDPPKIDLYFDPAVASDRISLSYSLPDTLREFCKDTVKIQEREAWIIYNYYSSIWYKSPWGWAGATKELFGSNKDTFDRLGLSVESTEKMVEWVQFLNTPPRKLQQLIKSPEDIERLFNAIASLKDNMLVSVAKKP